MFVFSREKEIIFISAVHFLSCNEYECGELKTHASTKKRIKPFAYLICGLVVQIIVSGVGRMLSRTSSRWGTR